MVNLSLPGYSVSGPSMQVLGQPASANLWVTSSPMVVQSLGPVSPVSAQAYTSGPLVPHAPQDPQPPQGLMVPYTDARWVNLCTTLGGGVYLPQLSFHCTDFWATLNKIHVRY